MLSDYLRGPWNACWCDERIVHHLRLNFDRFCSFVGLRRGLRFSGNGDLRPARVERLRDGLDETLRSTRNQGELHVVPVGANGVIHYSPALDDCAAVGFAREDHAVGGLPDRHFADVADVELALALAESIECEVAQASGMRGRQQLEIAIEFAPAGWSRWGVHSGSA